MVVPITDIVKMTLSVADISAELIISIPLYDWLNKFYAFIWQLLEFSGIVFRIPKCQYFINYIFLWLRGGHEAIIYANSVVNILGEEPTYLYRKCNMYL